MTVAAPLGASCAGHPETDAVWSCGRCGAFLCAACERRVRPEAVPMCPACWELRARTVRPAKVYSRIGLQNAALVLGLIGLLPLPAFQLAALILSVIAIVRAREPPARDVRWRAVVGLAATLVGIALELLIWLGSDG